MIGQKTKVTISFLLGAGVFLTPAVGSLIALSAQSSAHAEAIDTIKKRQTAYDEDLKKILEGIGELKGQLKQLRKGE